MSIVEIAKKTLELSEKATNGPWVAHRTLPNDYGAKRWIEPIMSRERPLVFYDHGAAENMELIAHNRNHCEQLAKAVILMREALEFYSEKHPWTIADIVLAKIDAPNLAAVDALTKEDKESL